MQKDLFKILIVDDSVVSMSHLKKILERAGYGVHTASSGLEALDIIGTLKPDIILLDIMMPEMDGFAVMEELRKNKETWAVPVLFLTGNDDQESKMRAFDLGAVDYIVKPFNPQEVKARVRVHLKIAVAQKSLVTEQTQKTRQFAEAQEWILLKPAELPEARFAVYCKPLAEAGGDFYDVIKVADDIFVYFVADVSGHDIATSYVNPAVKALLKQNCSPIYSAEETVSILNRVLVQTLPGEKYLSAFYLSVNRRSNRITYLSAGHPPAMLIRPGEPVRILETEADLIGISELARYPSLETVICSGDRIVLYTDGLVETKASGSVWPTQFKRLIPLLEELRDVPLAELPAVLVERMVPDLTDIDDDIIVLVLEV